MPSEPTTTDLWCLVRADMQHAMGPLPTKEDAVKAMLEVEQNNGETYLAVPFTFFGIKLDKAEWQKAQGEEPTDEWRAGGYL